MDLPTRDISWKQNYYHTKPGLKSQWSPAEGQLRDDPRERGLLRASTHGHTGVEQCVPEQSI